LRLGQNGSQRQYIPVFTGLPSNSNCNIKAYDITVAAICTQTAMNTTLLYQLEATIFIWLNLADVILLSNITETYLISNTIVYSAISPQLTKIFYTYYNSAGILTSVFKDINFETSTISNVNFIDASVFTATASVWSSHFTVNNFILADNFMAIRNDSINSVKNRYFVEQGYYFNDTTTLILLGQRTLA
jgi:hypothetical protein